MAKGVGAPCGEEAFGDVGERGPADADVGLPVAEPTAVAVVGEMGALPTEAPPPRPPSNCRRRVSVMSERPLSGHTDATRKTGRTKSISSNGPAAASAAEAEAEAPRGLAAADWEAEALAPPADGDGVGGTVGLRTTRSTRRWCGPLTIAPLAASVTVTVASTIATMAPSRQAKRHCAAASADIFTKPKPLLTPVLIFIRTDPLRTRGGLAVGGPNG